MGDLLRLGVPWYELILRSVVTYLVLLIGLRLFGKREVGQFTLFDLVFVLLVANAVQPAMTGSDSSLLGGVIIILSLLAANFAIGRLDTIPAINRFLTSKATLIVKDGKFIDSAMRREGVTREEALMSMREHGVAKIEEVQMAVLEGDGSISIVSDDKVNRTRRRVRYNRVGA
ncbi:MAG TPA: YetF domain-containing protein [Candidatus Dormibacteraeota bacterium]|nr:YetF domain-containing protein [Candidatus Dormibacteraeota bacterium]